MALITVKLASKCTKVKERCFKAITFQLRFEYTTKESSTIAGGTESETREGTEVYRTLKLLV
jgi:hypothetical protein